MRSTPRRRSEASHSLRIDSGLRVQRGSAMGLRSDRCAGFIGPVKLVQVNALHAQTAQRGLAFPANRFGLESAARLRHGVTLVPNQSALGEHKGPFGWPELAEQLADKFL